MVNLDIINPEYHTILEFHQLLKNKLFLSSVKSCNNKDELNYYIKPKDTLIALHDKFIRYGTKKATSFIIIDIDNVNKTLEEYAKEINYKLKGYEPSWITKTDKGFHIGFILENPLWLNNTIEKRRAEEIKKNLTIILDGDIAGSHRLVGYWRNPLTHKSVFNTKTHELKELEEITTIQYYECFSLFDNKAINNKKYENKTKDKKQIAKSNWEQIDKTGFTQGNRNNFLFNKVIGMLYNGLITNNEVLTTLESINNKELEDKEIQKIAKSILKYNIKPNNKQKERYYSKGIHNKELWSKKINNYRHKGKIEFARQQFGQRVTTINIIKKTVTELIKGYLRTYQNHEQFTNKNIEKNSNVSKRTIQRYRNERKLEESIKADAFRRYIKNLASKGVKANDTPVINIINFAIKTIRFCYKKENKLYKFEFNGSEKLLFYDTGQINELHVA